MVKVDEIPESVPEMAPLSEEKEGLILEFLEEVDAHYKDHVPFYVAREDTAEKRRIFAYKVLTARKWKMKNALEMVEKTVAFRALHDMDSWRLFPSAFPLRGYDEAAVCAMLEGMPGSDHLYPREGVTQVDRCYRALQASYVNVYHYWDKEGHPVLYDCCGHANVGQILSELARITPPGKSLGDVVVPYHTYMNEVQHYLIAYADQLSKRAGKHPIMGITVVMDMEGLSFKVVRPQFIQVVRAIFDVDQAYYPEVLHRLFIINAPSFFRIAYDFVKGSLDENTRRKLVFSSDKKEALAILKRVIDEDKIPQELGGSCRCEGGCLPRYVRPHTGENKSDTASNRTRSTHSGTDADVVPTETVHLAAGKESTRVFTVASGDEVTWEFCISGKGDVAFSAIFEPAGGDEASDAASSSKKSSAKRKAKEAASTAPTTVKQEKMNSDVDIYKATGPGTLTLVFSNKHSWVHAKQLELRVIVHSADSQAVA